LRKEQIDVAFLRTSTREVHGLLVHLLLVEPMLAALRLDTGMPRETLRSPLRRSPTRRSSSTRAITGRQFMTQPSRLVYKRDSAPGWVKKRRGSCLHSALWRLASEFPLFRHRCSTWPWLASYTAHSRGHHVQPPRFRLHAAAARCRPSFATLSVLYERLLDHSGRLRVDAG
jgi:hypothetical protein